MTLNDLLEYSGWLIGLAGFVYAIYANREASRLKDLARAEAWNLYQAANVACGTTQGALKMYKAKHASNLDGDVVEQLAKADALTLGVFHDAVRHVQVAEPRFDSKTIDAWVSAGKVSLDHRVNFVRVMVEDAPNQAKSVSVHNPAPSR
ncbi:MAG TPA: hypothetical protein DDX06_11190 [Curvibacter sp.]|nr:hypothetical protein [Curvibacter sp.]|tara:strand:- start:517 stop:963 length:447 start_codon:yes stop_codon:yes gene_type:complete